MNDAQPHTVYLALGTNITPKMEYLGRAVDKLKSITTDPIVCSQIFDTEPMGPTPQNRYLNMCVKLSTLLPPEELLEFCKNTEAQLGRIHRTKWGPREIDIDILFYADLKVNTEKLTIPHPEISKRTFVMLPLSRIAPQLHVPGLPCPLGEYISLLTTEDLQDCNFYSESLHFDNASQTH